MSSSTVTMHAKSSLVFLAVMTLAGCTAAPMRDGTQPIVWTLRGVTRVSGQPTEVLGSPGIGRVGSDDAIVFDGKDDGLLVPFNPLAGWAAFTIEVKFAPDGSGGEEQRFLHVEDDANHRVLLETRTSKRQWSLDTFLFQDAERKLTLLDRTRLHPTDRWYWVALVYDGQKMSQYINGVLELEGAVSFAPMSAGRTSIGVRQNRVSWFKGAISEVRFTPAALPARQLRSKP